MRGGRKLTVDNVADFLRGGRDNVANRSLTLLPVLPGLIGHLGAS